MKYQRILHDAYVVALDHRGDERRFFARVFCRNEFRERGLTEQLVQINNSLSADAGTLRGLHYQLPPKAETKIVRCVRGAFWDCIVDLRPDSPTFCQWYGIELTAENRLMMYVPKGHAHGFLTISEDSEAIYFTDEFYSPELERGIRWDDPTFAIRWPGKPRVLSAKDARHPDFDSEVHAREWSPAGESSA